MLSEEIPHAAIWAILTDECAAGPIMQQGFPFHWPKCREYRFMGALGFGGKIWDSAGRWYVTCYPEDETRARAAMVTRANERLAALRSTFQESK